MFSNVKIVASLVNPIALNDNWTPSFDGILSYQILFNARMLKQNPSIDQVKSGLAIVKENIPLEIGYLSNEKTSWYYKASSPHYVLNKKHNLGTGATKPWRVTSELTWYCRADLEKIEELLEAIQSIGKYRTLSYSIYLQDDKRVLMCDYRIKEWGWRCPPYLPDNQAQCYMPLHNISNE